MTTIHIAWDERAIDTAFEAVLGAAAAQFTRSKTTKTYCGKRVVYHHAKKFGEADCSDCIKRYVSEHDVLADLLVDERRRFLVDFDGQATYTFDEVVFLLEDDDSPDFSRAELEALSVGAELPIGGGAAPLGTIKRVS